MPSFMLVREGQTDLTPFQAPDLELARTQWLHELTRRMAVLEDARDLSANDLEYAGAASISFDIVPLEEAVDEARRMVCALQGEERRRSEGELPKWLRAEPVMPRTISAGL